MATQYLHKRISGRYHHPTTNGYACFVGPDEAQPLAAPIENYALLETSITLHPRAAFKFVHHLAFLSTNCFLAVEQALSRICNQDRPNAQVDLHLITKISSLPTRKEL